MTSDRLREIRERREKATPGSWQVVGQTDIYEGTLKIAEASTYSLAEGRWGFKMPQSESNASFIAHAPADIDYLLGEVARLTSTVEIMRKNMVTLQAETDQNLRDLGPNGSQ